MHSTAHPIVVFLSCNRSQSCLLTYSVHSVYRKESCLVCIGGRGCVVCIVGRVCIVCIGGRVCISCIVWYSVV